MHQWVAETKHLLEPLANAGNAGFMEAYMREQFPFLGIQATQRRAVLKNVFAKNKHPSVDELPVVVRELWSLPQREYQLVAVDLLIKLKKQLPLSIVNELEYCIVTKSWWDTVDLLATHIAGELHHKYPADFMHHLAGWQYSDNLWLKRTTLLYQLKYKDKTDAKRLFELIIYHYHDKDFFIQKAIGWALREYSKIAPVAVTEFIETNKIDGLAKREALKWLNKRRQ